MDEKMTNSSGAVSNSEALITSKSWIVYLIVVLVAGAIFLGSIVSPPSLMDDVDAVVAQIARNKIGRAHV